MNSVCKTDIGRIRAVNEDRVMLQPGLGGLTLAIVADGMGGHRAGDIASTMALETAQARLQHVHAGMTPEERKEAIREAVLHANRTVFEFAAGQEHYQGMGTTIVVALASDDRLVIGHIGDSRAYLITPGGLEQLTEDHSLVTELLRRGQITQEEAEHHPRRNVLTRALGTEPDVEVDLKQREWKLGDMLLLCSDGLSGMVDNRQLYRILRSEHDLDRKVNELIDQALQAGGDDNISVVLLDNDTSEVKDE